MARYKPLNQRSVVLVKKKIKEYLDSKVGNVAGLCNWLGVTLVELESCLYGNDELAFVLRMAIQSLVDKHIKDGNLRGLTLINNITSDYRGKLL